MVQSDYITTADVAKLLKISASTAQRMAREGRISALKVGKLWRFPAQSPGILLYKEQQKITRQPPTDAAMDADPRNGLKGFLKLACEIGFMDHVDRETLTGGRR
ncbi:MAG TPA: helix-turn-helix domain-containing protein [bacterium]|jgi:excisionase family DNA binding protein